MAGDSYQRIQQFITDSPWSASAVITAMALNCSDLYANQPNYRSRDVGYVIDESAHRKKGKQSVGVARQYAGVIGKVDNCQVGVYASLVWQSHSTLIVTVHPPQVASGTGGKAGASSPLRRAAIT